MAKIKIEKDNVVLSIEESDLGQYEARGFNKVGATKKVALTDLEKKVSKLEKENENLKAKINNAETEKANLSLENEELKAKVKDLEKKIK